MPMLIKILLRELILQVTFSVEGYCENNWSMTQPKYSAKTQNPAHIKVCA